MIVAPAFKPGTRQPKTSPVLLLLFSPVGTTETLVTELLLHGPMMRMACAVWAALHVLLTYGGPAAALGQYERDQQTADASRRQTVAQMLLQKRKQLGKCAGINRGEILPFGSIVAAATQ